MRRLWFAVLVFFCLALPSVAPGRELAGPAEGKARVYVFYFEWPVFNSWIGDPGTTQLFDGHSYVGSVDESQCYGFDLDPGTHLLWSKIKNNHKWFLRAEVKAGRTYYVQLRMKSPVVGNPSPILTNAGADDKPGKKSLKKINKRLAIEPVRDIHDLAFAVKEPATAEHIEAMQEELGPMIEEVMATWDESWSTLKKWDVIHESDYVK